MANEQKIVAIPEGKICDFIDGKFRNDTPEEHVRQTIEKRLVKEHKYARDRIRVEFPVKVGDAKKRVDLAVWDAGDAEKARQMQLKYLDLINALFIEVNPIPIKEAMNLRGMEVGGYRLPLCEMDPANRAKLIEAMKVLD